MSLSHQYQHLIRLFDALFFQDYNTRLIKGAGEPIYLPADEHCTYHRVEFAHGYYASALHEIAHWCIAGERRRQQEDYGYWYCADGRNQQQQSAFENVEIKPQALEWAFCVAAGKSFQVSTDNLDGVEPDRLTFQTRVYQQVKVYLESGFPTRAQQFILALQDFYQREALTLDAFEHTFSLSNRFIPSNTFYQEN